MWEWIIYGIALGINSYLGVLFFQLIQYKDKDQLKFKYLKKKWPYNLFYRLIRPKSQSEMQTISFHKRHRLSIIPTSVRKPRLLLELFLLKDITRFIHTNPNSLLCFYLTVSQQSYEYYTYMVQNQMDQYIEEQDTNRIRLSTNCVESYHKNDSFIYITIDDSHL
jgi:hypothetical protein